MTQRMNTSKTSLGLCLAFIAITNCGLILFDDSDVHADKHPTSSRQFWSPELTAIAVPSNVVVRVDPQYCNFGTGASIVVSPSNATELPDKDEQSSIAVMETHAEVIATIRSALSLNITELASVLGVERPTIYGWIQERSTPHPANYQRLLLVYRLAREWNKFRSQPAGDLVRRPAEDGRSLLDLLRQSTVDETAMTERLLAIADGPSQPTARERMASADPARRARMARRAQASSFELDVHTGKRVVID